MNDDLRVGEPGTADLIGLTATVVSAHIANNSVPATALAGLVASVHAALGGLGRPACSPRPTAPSRRAS